VILCQLLGVSRSGYYAWKERPARQDQLAPKVEEVFWFHSRRYGSRRIAAEAIKVDRPRQVIVGDITYLPLQTVDWAYLATWMDLFSRKIVGWRLADSMTGDWMRCARLLFQVSLSLLGRPIPISQ